jgi:8-oxo-dGTP pyrophosphatase MutT (NUDIX family)
MHRQQKFTEQLCRALALPPKPRTTAYAPELSYGRHAGPIPEQAKWGAVLVLFFPDAADWNLVLTVRQSHLPTHAGQVSFPGGKVDDGESAAEAARREYCEEVGELSSCHMLGTLPELYVFASDFRLTPCVAVTNEIPRFAPNAAEVADVFTVPLATLAARERRSEQMIRRGPLQFTAPGLRYQSKFIWGATWMILGELLERLEDLGPVRGW